MITEWTGIILFLPSKCWKYVEYTSQVCLWRCVQWTIQSLLHLNGWVENPLILLCNFYTWVGSARICVAFAYMIIFKAANLKQNATAILFCKSWRSTEMDELRRRLEFGNRNVKLQVRKMLGKNYIFLYFVSRMLFMRGSTFWKVNTVLWLK